MLNELYESVEEIHTHSDTRSKSCRQEQTTFLLLEVEKALVNQLNLKLWQNYPTSLLSEIH